MTVFKKAYGQKEKLPRENGEGYVRAASAREHGGDTYYSLGLVDSEAKVNGKVPDAEVSWLGTGKTAPMVEKGNFITFTYYTNRSGYLTMDADSIKVVQSKSVEVKKSGGGMVATGTGYSQDGAAWGNVSKQATDILLALINQPDNGGVPKAALTLKGLDKFVAIQHEIAVALFTANKDIPEVESEEEEEETTDEDAQDE